MAGHFRVHGNRWQLTWRLAGEQHSASWPIKAGESQRAAERRLAVEIGKNLAGQRRRDPLRRTVGDLLDMWYEAQEFERANTVRRLTSLLRRLKAVVIPQVDGPFGEVLADELEPWMVEAAWKVFRREGLQDSTIREYLAPIQTSYRWARKQKVRGLRGVLEPVVDRDVAVAIEEMDLPKRAAVRKTAYHICEWDELLTILDYFDGRATSMLMEASRSAAAAHWIRAGARPCEITGLAWPFVHLEEGYCDIEQKTVRTRGAGVIVEPALKSRNSTRRIGISGTVRELLGHQREWQTHWKWKMRSRWANEHNLVYTTHMGGPLESGDIWREIRMACDTLGMARFRPYDLRHAWKSHMRDETAWSVEDLAAFQGHSRETGEGTYRHVTTAAARKSRRIAEDFEALEQAARAARRKTERKAT